MAHENSNPTSDSGSSLAGAADASLAADAAAFVGGGAPPDAGFGGVSAEIERQAARLVEWARLRGCLLSEDHFSGLVQYPLATGEHQIFHRPADQRALKRTYPGTFGIAMDHRGQATVATPLFYLRRIQLVNEVFDSDLRLEGIALAQSPFHDAPDLQPAIVTSQPWIYDALPERPHPTEAEVEQFLTSLGFVSQPDCFHGWHRASDGMLVVDAREDNFIKSPGGVVPIDLVVLRWP